MLTTKENMVIRGIYDGEREYKFESLHENFYFANWGNDGNQDNSRITFNSHNTFVNGQAEYGSPRMFYDFGYRN